jgi:hypothetical protein
MQLSTSSSEESAMNWSTIGQTLVASLISAGIIAVVFRVVFERGLQHALDRRLKDYEAQLQERTALRTTFGEQRLDGYRNIIAEIHLTRRALRDCLEAEPDERLPAVEEYNEVTGNLQETLYNNALTLQQDGLYLQAHTYKVNCRTLAKRLRYAARVPAVAPSAPDQPEARWRDLDTDARQLIADGEDVAIALQTQVDTVLQGRK